MIGNSALMRIGTSVRRLTLGFACCVWLVASPALAHPHVWVTMKEELIYPPDGALVGIRHAWTFDEMFSAYATQGISAKTKGQFTREELQPLAKLNVEFLKEDGYYTNTWIDGHKRNDVFEAPTEYWLDYDTEKTELTLHVTLPLRTPLTAKDLMIQIYDPIFFVDFGLNENEPVDACDCSNAMRCIDFAARGQPIVFTWGKSALYEIGCEYWDGDAVRQQDSRAVPMSLLNEDNTSPKCAHIVAMLMTIVAIAWIMVISANRDAALAQTPFGASRASAETGLIGWLLAQQAVFYRALSGAVRLAKTDGSALWTLMGIAFAYGVFHAAGPGHGKAVISSYLLANDETWRRGVALSFAWALLQSLTAVLIVGIAAALLGATAQMMGNAARTIEIISYALIVLLGARLLWVKGLGFIRAARQLRDHRRGFAREAPGHHFAAGREHRADLDHGHGADHAHDHHHDHGHASDHDDEPDVLPWGHAHGPEPQDLGGIGRLEARAVRDRGRGPAPLFRRNHSLGVCAFAGAVLGGCGLHVCDGIGHSNNGRGDCYDCGGRQGVCETVCD